VIIKVTLWGILCPNVIIEKKNPLGFFSISEESKMAMHTIDKLKILENL
jgi:predicted transcriptional regulator